MHKRHRANVFTYILLLSVSVNYRGHVNVINTKINNSSNFDANHNCDSINYNLGNVHYTDKGFSNNATKTHRHTVRLDSRHCSCWLVLFKLLKMIHVCSCLLLVFYFFIMVNECSCLLISFYFFSIINTYSCLLVLFYFFFSFFFFFLKKVHVLLFLSFIQLL